MFREWRFLKWTDTVLHSQRFLKWTAIRKLLTGNTLPLWPRMYYEPLLLLHINKCIV